MPRLHNNSFANDTLSTRLARLSVLESQSSATLALLSFLPDDLRLWIPLCSTEYKAFLLTAEVHNNDVHASHRRLRLARATLRQELRYAKAFILSSYYADEVRRRAFGIEGKLPRKDADMLELAEQLLRVANEHILEGVDYRLSDTQYQRLAEATEAFALSRSIRGDSKSKKGSAHAAEDIRYHEDTQRLRRLLALWQSYYGSDDVRIKMLGMVKTKSGGNSAHPGVVHLSYDAEFRLFSCQPDSKRPAPTSYQLVFRLVGAKAWELYAQFAEKELGADSRLVPGKQYEFRARARNKHGFGKWSELVAVSTEELQV